MHLVEMMIVGPFAYWQYRNLQLLDRNPREVSYYTQAGARRDYRKPTEAEGDIKKQSEAVEDSRNQSGANENLGEQSEVHQLPELRGVVVEGDGYIGPAIDESEPDPEPLPEDQQRRNSVHLNIISVFPSREHTAEPGEGGKKDM